MNNLRKVFGSIIAIAALVVSCSLIHPPQPAHANDTIVTSNQALSVQGTSTSCTTTNTTSCAVVRCPYGQSSVVVNVGSGLSGSTETIYTAADIQGSPGTYGTPFQSYAPGTAGAQVQTITNGGKLYVGLGSDQWAEVVLTTLGSGSATATLTCSNSSLAGIAQGSATQPSPLYTQPVHDANPVQPSPLYTTPVHDAAPVEPSPLYTHQVNTPAPAPTCTPYGGGANQAICVANIAPSASPAVTVSPGLIPVYAHVGPSPGSQAGFSGSLPSGTNYAAVDSNGHQPVNVCSGAAVACATTAAGASSTMILAGNPPFTHTILSATSGTCTNLSNVAVYVKAILYPTNVAQTGTLTLYDEASATCTTPIYVSLTRPITTTTFWLPPEDELNMRFGTGISYKWTTAAEQGNVYLLTY